MTETAGLSSGRFSGRVVLITGASRGLGRALALAFAREGADLALCSRHPEELEPVRRQVEAWGRRCLSVPADMGRRQEVERLAAQVFEAYGHVDVLINNASELGPTPMPFLVDTPPDWLERVLATNVTGPFLLTRAVLGNMLARGSGAVINVTSDAAVEAYPAWGAYGLSKAALEAMTRIWAAELAESGVRINCVDPGEMNTRMHAAAIPDADPSTLAEPEDVVGVFLHLAADPTAGSGKRYEAQAWRKGEAPRA